MLTYPTTIKELKEFIKNIPDQVLVTRFHIQSRDYDYKWDMNKETLKRLLTKLKEQDA